MTSILIALILIIAVKQRMDIGARPYVYEFLMVLTVIYRPIARQQLGKNIPMEVYACNRTSIVRQQISKQSFSTIERLCFLHDPCRGVIKGQRSFE
jgi:hypothetical protein